MTEQSIQKRARLLDEKIKTLQRFDRDDELKDFIRGKELYAIKKRKYYLAYGDHIKTFEDFLRETKIDEENVERPIIGFGRTKAYDLIKWYDLNKDVPNRVRGIEYTKWKQLLPYITKENRNDMILMARGPADHFKEFIKELKGRPTTDRCDHELYKEKWIYLVKCSNCGKMWRKPKTLDK
ncbi:MAG: hypothetical protein PHW73_14675 [Atribacterota bacterium]|jgi:hypothetical protein|nr:hypothetical protein [Atribacterota bacterium]